jgi:beta-xylosidase
MSETRTTGTDASTRTTYANPVYDGYFADPFVWKARGVYYAIGTGVVEASGIDTGRKQGTLFPMLRSEDFFNWKPVGGALVRPDNPPGDHFWAPEVAERDGKFYMYYSVGWGDKNHRLYVATSDDPAGPYEQAAGPLVDPETTPFAIDPCPFRDDDGQWYLFYARDYLDTENGLRAGTALAVDRMVSMTELAGEPKTVLRARYDWQLFKAQREMYGKVYDWHTLEGPAVRKHNGTYYCLFSASNWETVDYGVDYCEAKNPLGPWSGEDPAGPRILKTVPGFVRGPGHNSIVTGPDGKTDYIVYHAWDPELTARKMCIDKLIWTPQGPRCEGPTWTEQKIG